MNKKEAAEVLGVSPKTIERFVAQGKLKAVKVSGRTGLESSFDPAKVEALRVERATPIEALAQVETSQDRQPETVSQSEAIAMIAHAMQTISSRLDETRQLRAGNVEAETIADLSHLLTLDLKQAARLSGLSRSMLLDAIHNNKLKAQKLGRGWRIKRADLDKYIAGL